MPELLEAVNFQYWILQSIAMMLTALLIPKFEISNPFSALATVVVLSFVNAQVWDTALFFHIPDHISVQFPMLLIANGVIFWVIAKFVPGIDVKGFLPAVAAPLVFTITSWVIGTYFKDVDLWALALTIIDYVSQAREYFLNSGLEHSSIPNMGPTLTP